MAGTRAVARLGESAAWRAAHLAPRPLDVAGARRGYASYRRFGGKEGATYGSPLGAIVVNLIVNHRRGLIIGTVVVGTLVYTFGTDQAPVTGRRRLMIVPPAVEKQVGDMQYQQLLQEFNGKLLHPSHPESRRVRRIVERLVKASPDLVGDGIDWQVHVVADSSYPPNAFVMPGGKVFVFASILPITANDDGLAAVLAHETAHQVARHSAEKMSSMPLIGIVGTLVYALTGGGMGVDFVRLGMELLLNRPASRQMETEADYIGLMMMSRACYDPHEAVHMWERMYKTEQTHPVQFLSTHPATQNRIAHIREWMPEAEAKLEASECATTARYASAFGSMWT
ncbi:peptidase family M48-domain-containing protein [Dipodascopsis tothii]|uniref:peptidase family M48-domain-containing protein n=1 Tax=Dipodascopsis tothii TaxID=44089 RepID=UPI0034CF56FF